MQHVVERAERHELADDDQTRRLVAHAKHRQDVRMVEDPGMHTTTVNRKAKVASLVAATYRCFAGFQMSKDNKIIQNGSRHHDQLVTSILWPSSWSSLASSVDILL